MKSLTNKLNKISFIKFVVVLICVFMISISAHADFLKENKSTQEPMYSNPEYVNNNLNTSADLPTSENSNSEKPSQAPPPGEPDPSNQVPVPSGILPLLAMAFGLTLWRVHVHLRKVKTTK